MDVESIERLKLERRLIFKAYYDLRASLGDVEEIRKLASNVHLPSLQKVGDQDAVAKMLDEVRNYLIGVSVAIEEFDQEKGFNYVRTNKIMDSAPREE